MKNWCLTAQEAYKNYEKIVLKEKMEHEKKIGTNNPIFKDINYTDFVVRTDNNGKGKTLIFLGKAINIYIDDIDKYHTNDQGISMAVEESEFNKKIKNEIVYTFDDISLKKRNWSINIKNEFNNLQNKNKNINKHKKNKLKSNKNSDLKNNTFRRSADTKDIKIKNVKLNNNLFKNYNQNPKKLPSITKLSKQNIIDRRRILKEPKFGNNDLNYTENTKMKLKYKNIFPFKEKNKNSKNSFKIFEKELTPNNKTIYNFFSKQNSDFYY